MMKQKVLTTTILIFVFNFLQAQINYNLIIPKREFTYKEKIKKIHDELGGNGIFCDGLISVENEQGKYGFMDTAFNLIIPYKYHDTGNFSDGIAPVALKEYENGEYQWGYINKSNELIFTIDYNFASSFSNNRAIVVYNNKNIRRCGAIDKKGNLVVPLKFYNIGNFSYGVACASLQRNKTSYNLSNGYVDTLGNIITEIKYDNAYAFSNGYGLIEDEKKYFFVNADGENVFNESFDLAQSFNNGYAIVKKNKTWSYIDTLGNKFGEFDSISGSQVFKNSKMTYFTRQKTLLTDFYDFVNLLDIIQVRDNSRFALVSNGEIISDWYDDIYSSFDGDTILVVRKNDKYYFLTNSGKVLFNKEFESAQVFTNNRALVKYKQKSMFIDRSGMEIQTNNLIPDATYSENLASVKNEKNLYGFVDTTGKLVIECKFQEVSFFQHALCCVKYKNKYGFINANGKFIVKPKYREAVDFSDTWINNKIYAMVGSKKNYLINKEGEKIFLLEYYAVENDPLGEWGYKMIRLIKD